MKKKLFGSILFVTLSSFLMACQNGNDKTKISTTQDQSTTKEKISIGVNPFDGLKDLTENQISRFLETNPKILEKYDFDIFTNDVHVEFIDQNKGVPDIYFGYSDDLPCLVERGYASKISSQYISEVTNRNRSISIKFSSVNNDFMLIQ